MTESVPLLEARQISKRFGDFVANDQISIRIFPGQIHALLGENGAGKSTLVKILYGTLQPSDGRLFWQGGALKLTNPAAARALGIGMIFQHFSLFDALTVTENIALALPGSFSPGTLATRIRVVSEQYGLALEPNAWVADLSVGERQRVEVVRCLLAEPRLLIMDEPTAVLTPQESQALFDTLERLVEQGISILYISHRLEEVKRLCHHATVLRQGKVVGRVNPREETPGSLARLMVGTDVHVVNVEEGARRSEPLLEVRHLNVSADGPFNVTLHEVNLVVMAGEVMAIAGVAGNGQAELFDVLSGERKAPDNASLHIAGVPCGQLDIGGRRRLGAAFVPEERLGHGAIGLGRLSDNVLLTRHSCEPGLVRSGQVALRAVRTLAARVKESFDVRAADEDPLAGSLSGGNLQKFIVGRELDRHPKLVVVHQPTWGVDAGAAALIRQALVDLAQSGSAVVLISQDLDEVFAIANRISVMSKGRLSSDYPAAKIDRERIGLLMTGGVAFEAEL